MASSSVPLAQVADTEHSSSTEQAEFDNPGNQANEHVSEPDQAKEHVSEPGLMFSTEECNHLNIAESELQDACRNVDLEMANNGSKFCIPFQFLIEKC